MPVITTTSGFVDDTWAPLPQLPQFLIVPFEIILYDMLCELFSPLLSLIYSHLEELLFSVSISEFEPDSWASGIAPPCTHRFPFIFDVCQFEIKTEFNVPNRLVAVLVCAIDQYSVALESNPDCDWPCRTHLDFGHEPSFEGIPA